MAQALSTPTALFRASLLRRLTASTLAGLAPFKGRWFSIAAPEATSPPFGAVRMISENPGVSSDGAANFHRDTVQISLYHTDLVAADLGKEAVNAELLTPGHWTDVLSGHTVFCQSCLPAGGSFEDYDAALGRFVCVVRVEVCYSVEAVA